MSTRSLGLSDTGYVISDRAIRHPDISIRHPVVTRVPTLRFPIGLIYWTLGDTLYNCLGYLVISNAYGILVSDGGVYSLLTFSISSI